MAKGDFIAIDIEGLAPLVKGLDKLPQEVQDAAGDDVSEYLINVLKHYPSQKRVTRAQAYGTTFFSDKQRRWFFAALKSGAISVPYRRTQTFRAGWRQIGKGIKSIIANEVEYGGFLMGDSEQSRMHKLIGWKTLSKVIDERKSKIVKILEAAAKKGMSKAGFR
jgi:hypothetical protein